MPPKSYTILILPHKRTRFRKVHLSQRAIVWGVVALVLVTISTAVLPHVMVRLTRQSSTVAELERENARLHDERQRFEDAVDSLNSRLSEFEGEATRLAAALGIEELLSSQPAAGGPSDGLDLSDDSPFSSEFTALNARGDALETSFDTLGDAWMERERMLASTPGVMPVRGWFSHGYGWRKDPFTGKRAFHRGVDIVAPGGTPIRASADGMVSKAGRLGAYGKRVDLSHGYGYISRYAHMSEILVKPGQRVKRGDVIGRVGSTGRSTAPHLHYEIFRDGRRVNPWKYLGDKGF